MTKVVISTCYGGFGLSHDAEVLYLTGKGIPYTVSESTWSGSSDKRQCNVSKEDNGGEYYCDGDIPRDDPLLVRIVESLGTEKASSWASKLEVIEIPDDVEWTIQEYDGTEWIAEAHRTWPSYDY